MRKTNILVRISLIIVVLISLVLSYLIWTNNQRYEKRTDTQTTTKRDVTSSDTNEQNLAQVYLPTEIISVDSKSQHHLIYNHKESLVSELRDTMKTWKIWTAHASTSKYDELISQSNTVQLVNPDQISLQLFGKVEAQKALKNAIRDRSFTRVIFSTEGDIDKVFFVNDQTKKIWQSRVTDAKVSKILSLLRAADYSAKVALRSVQGQVRTFYPEGLSLRPYSYLITRRNENTYISALLSDSANSTVDTRESGNETTYYAGNYNDYQLLVDHSTDQLKYTDNTQSDVPASLQALLEQSFKAISEVDNPLTDVRFFDADTDNNTVSFRSYVEGFPIFQQSDFGAFKVSYTNTGSQVDFSSRILQVPIPATTSRVALPSTQSVLDTLKNAGYATDKIQDIIVGYRWVPDTESTDIIDLKPTYYVQIGGKWRDYQDWLADKSEVK
ncbi:YycH family regulatory protein [Lapidilactobacillus mulanensis]|uniref:YycH family regulatory protein n=1 Tax=Lapidilactobacillus mulanensis TaxID=2485999 RepID=A0ABW4DQB9_9LACO|nr:two-component system activity regulator YycH [Lapidilactobacillus mulanensis]